MKRKILAAALSACMIFSLLPMSALANELENEYSTPATDEVYEPDAAADTEANSENNDPDDGSFIESDVPFTEDDGPFIEDDGPGTEAIDPDYGISTIADGQSKLYIMADSNGGSVETTVNNTAVSSGSSVEIGATVKIKVTPNAGYEINSVTYNYANDEDEIELNTNGEGEFTMPNEQTVLEVTFKLTDYTISDGKITDGSVTYTAGTITNATTANYQQTVTIVGTPDAGKTGYEITAVTVKSGDNEVDVTRVNGLEWQFTMPAGNVTVDVTFGVPLGIDIGTFAHGKVVAQVDGIEVEGTSEGNTVTLVITPEAGYVLATLTVTQKNEAATPVTVSGTSTTKRTFIMPAENVLVEATFQKRDLTILNQSGTTGGNTVTFQVGENGTAQTNPSIVTAQVDDTVTITATAANGYRVAGIVFEDGNYDEVEPKSGPTQNDDGTVTWTFTMPPSASTVTVEFQEVKTLTVTEVDNANVTVKANGVEVESDGDNYTLAVGTEVTVEVKVDTGYLLNALTIKSDTDSEGTSVLNNATYDKTTNTYTYTFTLSADTEINATTAATHILTITVPTNGKVTVSAGDSITVTPTSDSNTLTIAEGATVTITTTPDTGYKVDGTPSVTATENTTVNGSNDTYTFTMPNSSATLDVEFAQVDYNIEIDGIPDGVTNSPVTVKVGTNTEDATASITAHYEDSITVTTEPSCVAGGKTYQFITIAIKDAEGNTVEQSTGSPTTDNDGNTIYTFAMPASNVTITATYSEVYTLTISGANYESIITDKNGSVGATYDLEGDSGTTSSEDVTFSENGSALEAMIPTGATNLQVVFTPDTGYGIQSLTSNATSVLDGNDWNADTNTYTADNLRNNIELTVQFEKQVTVTVEVDPDGKAGVEIKLASDSTDASAIDDGDDNDGTGSDSATTTTNTYTFFSGDDVTITVTPDDGYTIKSVTANNQPINEDSQNPNTYTTTVTTDTKILVTLEANNQTITTIIASATEGDNVDHGTVSYLVDGKEATSGEGGTVEAPTGSTVTVVPSAYPGYEVKSVTCALTDDSSGTAPTPVKNTNGSYAFEMPAESVTVTVTFEAIGYSIDVEYDKTQGSAEAQVNGQTAKKVNVGDTVTIKGNPEPGYKVSKMTVKFNFKIIGLDQVFKAESDLTVNNDTAQWTVASTNPIEPASTGSDITVTVTYEKIDYTVDVDTTGNPEGSSVIVDQTSRTIGEPVVITADAPTTGTLYSVGEITVTYGNGLELTLGDGVTPVENSTNQWTFNMPAGNATVKVTFVASYELTVSTTPTGGGTVTATATAENETDAVDVDFVSGKALIEQDSKVVLTITPAEGYTFESMTVGNTTVDPLPTPDGTGVVTYTISTLDNNTDVKVTFKLNDYNITTTSVDTNDGTVKVTVGSSTEDATNANKGDKVTVTATAKDESNKVPVSIEVKGKTSQNTILSETADLEELYTENKDEYTWEFTMPAEDVTVTVTFGEIVTLTQSDDSVVGNMGSVAVTDDNDNTIEAGGNDGNVYYIVSGSEVTITATPKSGYIVESMSVEDNDYPEEETANPKKFTDTNGVISYTITNIDSDTDFSVKFNSMPLTMQVELDENTTESITVQIDDGDEKTLSTSQEFTTHVGETVTIDATPIASGVVIQDVTVSATTVTDPKTPDILATRNADGKYEFTMPGYDVTVTVTFGKPHTITFDDTNTENGTITIDPDGEVAEGATVILTPLPDYGFKADTVIMSYNALVTVPGLGQVTTHLDLPLSTDKMVNGKYWEFDMPASDVTVTATFKLAENSITSSTPEPAHGTFTIDPETATKGEMITITPNALNGYHVESVVYTYTDAKGDEVTSDPLTLNSNGVYTFEMPGSAVVVDMTFAANVHTVTVMDGTHGTVTTDAEDGEAAFDTTVTITAVPDTGYEVDSITVTDADNATVEMTTSNSFTMPNSDVTVDVTFKAKSYSVSTNPNISNGSVEVTSTLTDGKATFGSTVTFTATPASQYTVKSVTVTCDDSTVTAPTPPLSNGVYTFTMPASNVTISAEFEEFHLLTVSDTTNGSVAVTVNNTTPTKTADGKYEITMNSDVTLTLSPAEGYEVDSVTATNGTPTADPNNKNIYTINNMTQDTTVTVSFKPIDYTITNNTASEAKGTASVKVDSADFDLSTEKAHIGETVVITVTPTAGYYITSMKINNETITATTEDITVGTSGTATTYTFQMPAQDTTFEATFQARTYTLAYQLYDEHNDKVDEAHVGGTYVVVPDGTAATGEDVHIVAIAPEGYTIESSGVTATYGDNNTSVSVTPGSSGVAWSFEMPAGNTIVKIVLKEDSSGSDPVEDGKFTVTTTDVSNGTLTVTVVEPPVADEDDTSAEATAEETETTTTDFVNGNAYAENSTITVTAAPNPGYEVEVLNVKIGTAPTTLTKDSEEEDFSIAADGTFTYTFTLTKNTTISADFEKADLNINIDSNIAHGGITTLPAGKTQVGEAVTIITSADNGYILKSGSLKVTYTVDGTTHDVATEKGTLDNMLTFTMPAYDVTITAEFEADGSTTTPEEPDKPGDTDVSAGATVTPSVSGDTATANVTSSDITSAIEEAIQKEGGALQDVSSVPSITINAKSNDTTVASTQVTLPHDVIEQLNQYDTESITIQTNAGEVTLPSEIWDKYSDGSDGLTLVVEDRLDGSPDGVEVSQILGSIDVTLYKSSAPNTPLNINGLDEPITLSVYIGPRDSAPQLWYWNGTTSEKVESSYDQTTGMLTFKTTHLSGWYWTDEDVEPTQYTIDVASKTEGATSTAVNLSFSGNFDGNQYLVISYTYEDRVFQFSMPLPAGMTTYGFSYESDVKTAMAYIVVGAPDLTVEGFGSDSSIVAAVDITGWNA